MTTLQCSNRSIRVGFPTRGVLQEKLTGDIVTKITGFVKKLRTFNPEAPLDSIQISIERGIRFLDATGQRAVRFHLDVVRVWQL